MGRDIKILVGTVIFLLAVAVDGRADVFVLDATDAGFVTVMGGSSKGDGTIVPSAKYNYSVGLEVHYGDGTPGSDLVPMDRKNYFIFDLTGITEPIIDATLIVYAGPAVPPPFPDGMHGYESLDPSELFVVGETTDPLAALGMADALATGSTPGEFDDPSDPLVGVAAALYTKLADGPLAVGSTLVTAADDGSFLAIPISPPGLGYLNIFVGSRLILGGTLPTATPPPVPQEIFGFTGPIIPAGDPLTPKLMVTTIPEPPALAGLALLAAAAARRPRPQRITSAAARWPNGTGPAIPGASELTPGVSP